MKPLLIASILFLSSCCPKIAEVIHSSDTVRTETSDTTYGSLELNILPDSSDEISFNALTFCDSLQAGLIALPYKVISGHRSPNGKRKVIGSLTVDTTGRAVIRCNEDQYKLTIDSQATVIKTATVTITNLDKIVKERSGYRFYQAGFFIELFLLLAFIAFLIHALKTK